MIMLLITIVLMAVSFGWLSLFYARYCFKIAARKFYTTTELSSEFRTQFDAQLAQCGLPCKRFVSSQVVQMWQGEDDRPVIYAAGELYINEDRCKNLSHEEFVAGLLYEQAHHDTAFYIYSEIIMAIIFIGCMPLVALLNGILQSWVVHGHPWQVVFGLAYVVNLLQTWPLLQFIPLLAGTILLEFALGESVVNFYAGKGYNLKALCSYLQYVENTVAAGLNSTFNVSSNRKRCEKLLEEE